MAYPQRKGYLPAQLCVRQGVSCRDSPIDRLREMPTRRQRPAVPNALLRSAPKPAGHRGKQCSKVRIWLLEGSCRFGGLLVSSAPSSVTLPFRSSRHGNPRYLGSSPGGGGEEDAEDKEGEKGEKDMDDVE